MNTLPVQIPQTELSATGLSIANALDIQQWKQIGHTLCQCQGAIQWWIGDWINYGNHNYGTKYTEAIKVFGEEAIEYGYDAQTIRVFASVGHRVTKRFNNLSWSHHLIVSPLKENEQLKWLTLSIQEKWTVKQLKAAIKEQMADPLAGVSHKAGFSWLAWVNEGERWLNSEIERGSLADWDTDRLDAINRDLGRLMPVKAAIEDELRRRMN